MKKLKFEVPNYYHLAPRNYGKAKYEYPQVIDYLENEIHRLYLIIDKAIEYIDNSTINPEDLTLYDNMTKEEYLMLKKILKGEE